jgi:hypothetical protein
VGLSLSPTLHVRRLQRGSSGQNRVRGYLATPAITNLAVVDDSKALGIVTARR